MKIHTRSAPLDPDVDLKIIAENTPGFVGADLKALVAEAALISISEFLPEIQNNQPVPTKVLDDLKISMNHFRTALGKMRKNP